MRIQRKLHIKNFQGKHCISSSQDTSKNECGHSLANAMHKVSDHKSIINGSDQLPLLPTDYIKSQEAWLKLIN